MYKEFSYCIIFPDNLSIQKITKYSPNFLFTRLVVKLYAKYRPFSLHTHTNMQFCAALLHSPT